MKKKLIALLLIFSMVFVLAACGSNEKKEEATEETTEEAEAEAEAEAEEEAAEEEVSAPSWTDPETIVTNGPYKLDEWVHDSYISFVKNENYYDYDNLGPEKIIYYLSDSETAILSAYESGEYDFIENVPTDRIADLKESGDLHINDYVGTYYLYLNCDNVPDWRARAAILLVTDQKNIVENVTQGGQVPATGLVAAGIADSTGANFADESAKELPPMYAWLQENYGNANDLDLNEYEDRCELAKILLDEAVAEGFDTSTTIYYRYNTSETHQAIAEAVQEDVNSVLGLNMELTNQDWNVYTNGLAEGDFGVARLGWIADYNDPITYLELFVNGNSYNYSNWVSDEYTGLINQAKTLPAGAERDALLYEAEKVLFSEGGFAVNPLYFYTNLYCVKEGIENLEYTPFGYYFFSHATGKDTITACIASEPETIDPGLISSVDGSTYTQHQFEALMKYVKVDELAGDGPNMYSTKPDYGMAVSHEVSEDQMTYTFTLRDEAVWSDGQPVTANDFVYSWQRIVNPATASEYGYILDGIVLNAAAIQAGEKDPSELGIEAVDDKTLKITLEAPCPYFLELCAFASLMPLRQDVVEG